MKAISALMLLLKLAAAAGNLSEMQPSDCVQYAVSDVPRRTVTKSFGAQVRLGLEALYARGKWEAELQIKSPHSDLTCTIIFKMQGGENDDHASDGNEIISRCSSWTKVQEVVINNTNILNNYGWSYFDLFVTASNDILLVSTKKPEVEIVKVPDTGFSGNLEAQWLPKRTLMHVNFDCHSECHLRSGIEYHSTLGDHFFFWRETALESIQFQAFPNSYSYSFSLEDGAARQVVGSWIEIRFEAESKRIIWNQLGSNTSHFVPWTAGHIHSYFDIQNHLTIHVPSSCLVTKYHPYQLPCPQDPLQCQAVELWTNNRYVSKLLSEWQMTVEWIVLAVMLMIICFLILLVCCLKRKLKLYEMKDTAAMELNRRTSSGSPKSKISRLMRKSEIYDDFSSGEFSSPAEQRPIQNAYSNRPPPREPNRLSTMYANLPKMYKR
ncbi:hypothetical protein FHG87_004939 [Trinorchestia longiramus]|nr:hypothetical protein FHG87_004939 [Trinorchestia longiramus]